jgi:putative intracellular protease/amidase
MNRWCVLLILVLLATPISPSKANQIISSELEDFNVLAVIGYSFGWSYFLLEEIFESWGVGFYVTGETETVQSCINRAPRPVDVDILISDIDREIISNYDCLIKPSGGHWTGLCVSTPVLDLISMAYEEGLIVSGICTGTAPIARADIVNGTYVTGHTFTGQHVRAFDGILKSLARIVTDRHIVTGSGGSGVQSGFEVAPHYDLCVAVMKELLGQSYFVEATATPVPSNLESKRVLNVVTSGQLEVFDNVTTAEMDEVIARIHPMDNASDVTEIELTMHEDGVTFSGNVSDLELGEYNVNLEIQDQNRSLEIVRNATSFTLEDFTTTSTTGLEIPIFATAAVMAVVGVVVVVVGVIWKKTQ